MICCMEFAFLIYINVGCYFDPVHETQLWRSTDGWQFSGTLKLQLRSRRRHFFLVRGCWCKCGGCTTGACTLASSFTLKFIRRWNKSPTTSLLRSMYNSDWCSLQVSLHPSKCSCLDGFILRSTCEADRTKSAFLIAWHTVVLPTRSEFFNIFKTSWCFPMRACSMQSNPLSSTCKGSEPCSKSSRASSIFPRAAAMIRAVRPEWSTAWTLAPAFSNANIAGRCAYMAVRIKGWEPLESSTFALAPQSISIEIILMFPE